MIEAIVVIGATEATEAIETATASADAPGPQNIEAPAVGRVMTPTHRAAPTVIGSVKSATPALVAGTEEEGSENGIATEAEIAAAPDDAKGDETTTAETDERGTHTRTDAVAVGIGAKTSVAAMSPISPAEAPRLPRPSGNQHRT